MLPKRVIASGQAEASEQGVNLVRTWNVEAPSSFVLFRFRGCCDAVVTRMHHVMHHCAPADAVADWTVFCLCSVGRETCSCCGGVAQP